MLTQGQWTFLWFLCKKAGDMANFFRPNNLFMKTRRNIWEEADGGVIRSFQI